MLHRNGKIVLCLTAVVIVETAAVVWLVAERRPDLRQVWHTPRAVMPEPEKGAIRRSTELRETHLRKLSAKLADRLQGKKVIDYLLENEVPEGVYRELIEAQSWYYGYWNQPLGKHRAKVLALRRDITCEVLLNILDSEVSSDVSVVNVVLQMTGAAQMLGPLGNEAAVEPLVEIVTTRFSGEFTSSSFGHLQWRALESLGLLSRTNPRAFDFLCTRADIANWGDIAFTQDYDKKWTQAYQTAKAINALVRNPCPRTIECLEAVKAKYSSICDVPRIAYWHRYIGNRIALCKSFVSSGESYEDYLQEIYEKGVYNNKYLGDVWGIFLKPEE